MTIPRYIKQPIHTKLEPNMVVVLYGPRQIGKTTLLKEIINETPHDHLFITGEDIYVQEWLSSQSIDRLKHHIGSKNLLIIDEAQKVSNIGLNLKLIVDHIPGIHIIATGSSSFELANQVGEPLVGRKWQFLLYPIAHLELQQNESIVQTQAQLETRLIYGTYPRVVTTPDIPDKRDLLESILEEYVFKDLLTFDEIRKSQKVIDILKLIAFQIGKEVSLQELGSNVGLNMRTVERYLDLLEKVFVIKRIYGFSRNLRKEVTKTSRYYFVDNGIRNAIINNFNDFTRRDDIGQLWENYLVMERLKKQHYTKLYAHNYFWRTWDRYEIDFVEEREGKLCGYEFKWDTNHRSTPPHDWVNTYPNAEYTIIDRDNYMSFIG